MHSTDVAVLGGGCFWCLEAVFEQLNGIEKVVSGYSGGAVDQPSYQEICTGATGHAEVVKLTFDPQVISFEVLLEVFFTVHDPTTLNRQGADVGPQYRSVIFCRDEEQRQAAEQVVERFESARIWEQPIVTEIVPFEAFFPAEDYHQEYFRRNSRQSYCQVVIAPKVAKFRQSYMARLKEK